MQFLIIPMAQHGSPWNQLLDGWILTLICVSTFFAVHLKVTGRCFWMIVSDTRKSLGVMLNSLQMSLLMSVLVLRARSPSTPHGVHTSVPELSKLFDIISSIYPQLVKLLIKSQVLPVTHFSARLDPKRTLILTLGLSKICLLAGTTAGARRCVYRPVTANVYKQITANLKGKILCSRSIPPTRSTLMKTN